MNVPLFKLIDPKKLERMYGRRKQVKVMEYQPGTTTKKNRGSQSLSATQKLWVIDRHLAETADLCGECRVLPGVLKILRHTSIGTRSTVRRNGK